MADSKAKAPEYNHVGVVCKNVEKVAETLSEILELGEWTVFDYTPRREDLMIDEPFTIKAATIKVTDSTELHLMEPTAGKSYFDKVMGTGEGVHHFCFTVYDFDAIVSKLKAKGGKLVIGAVFEGKRWAYFETQAGGIVLEVIEA